MTSISRTNTNIELFKNELEKLSDIGKHNKIRDTDLTSIVNRLDVLAKNIITEYSKTKSTSEVTQLLTDAKTKIREATLLLKKSGIKPGTGKLQIIFTSIKSPKKDSGVPIANKGIIRKIIDDNKQGFRLHNKKVKLVNDITSSLANLELKIDDFQTYNLAVEHFKMHTHFPEKLSALKDKFINGLFSFILSKISSFVFLGHKSQVNLAKAKIELSNSEKLQKKNEAQMEALNKKKLELSSQPSSPKYEKLEKEIESLTNNQNKIEKEITKAKEKIKFEEGLLELGKANRKNFFAIGGENVKIDIPIDNVKLDGFYIACDSFRKTLKEAGALSYNLSIVNNTEENKKLNLTGLILPSSTVDEALIALDAFSTPEKPGAGWQKLELQDGSMAIITDEEAQKLIQMGVMSEGKLNNNQDWNFNLEKEKFEPSKPSMGGTVLLTSGNAGVYEMHNKEILAFLMRGMNVMAINFRGYGTSTGNPTEQGLIRDIDAAYQYIKEKHSIADEKILLKALCVSGGPATSFAAQHPNVNLFIDQSYADFNDLIQEQLKENIDDFVKDNSLDYPKIKSLTKWVYKNMPSLVHAFVKLAAPAWSIKKEIGKLKGHIGILLTTKDDTMKLDRDVQRNYQAALNSGKAHSVSIFAMEGEHGNSWLKPLSNPYPAKFVDEATAKSISSKLKEKIHKGRLTELSSKQEDFAQVSEDVEILSKKIAEAENEMPGDERQAKIAEASQFRMKKELEELIAKKEKLSKKIASLPNLEAFEGYTTSKTMEELTNEMNEIEDKYGLPRIFIREILEIRVLNDLEAKMAEGQKLTDWDIEEIIDNYLKDNDVIKDKEAIPIIKEFIKKNITKKDMFLDAYKKIINITKAQSISKPKDISRLIQNVIEDSNPEIQVVLGKFLRKTINFSEEIALDERMQQPVYEGRVQMDIYLKKARLTGSFV